MNHFKLGSSGAVHRCKPPLVVAAAWPAAVDEDHVTDFEKPQRKRCVFVVPERL